MRGTSQIEKVLRKTSQRVRVPARGPPTQRTQRSIGGGGDENSRNRSFHLDTLRVATLVPHPALQPGAEVVDPSEGNEGFHGSGAGIRPSGTRFRGFLPGALQHKNKKTFASSEAKSWLYFGSFFFVWGILVAPGALETLQKGGGLCPPPFWRVSRAPGAAQTPKMTDFQSLHKF